MPIEEIINLRRTMPAYDEELWSFMGRVSGRNLENVSNASLQERLDKIDRNIQYLDNGNTQRDSLHADTGWLSPWWWLRARHWTMLEFHRRGASPAPTPGIRPMPALAPGFDGVMAGGRKLLVRLDEERWLLNLLNGRVRFAPAASYRDTGLDAARADEEMSKAYRRPGQAIRITGPDGGMIDPIGDVVFASRRSVERNGELHDIPYWFCSFSSDLDPRLFEEFTGSEACIVIFEPMKFVERALPHLNRAAPHTVKSLFQNEYFDPHFPGGHKPKAMVSKEMTFAYQREMRFALDPEGGPPLADGALFVEIGSIKDIAAVYAATGAKIAGTGPDSFLV
ncbi:hypothetical protein [Rhizobium ruizarguesonis]|uniref:hypothetical protein n=1 Tax=Rhizobium ruizarguesonis TaxID=2081791 RepID=UPI00102F6046|nr:hypothetical protein [Rhizobium ruizarguesonis]TAY85035.1 hypothetical protein ELH85_30785 [Rhizobium ruizarguesonis]